MIRISKLTDYGIVLLTRFASGGGVRTARDLADETGIPRPTVAKLLKTLAHAGLLASRRGVGGGFDLTRPAAQISVADVVGALDGPIALTECLGADEHVCDLEARCPVRSNWGRINAVVREALSRLTIAEMARPAPAGTPLPGPAFAGSAVSSPDGPGARARASRLAPPSEHA